MRFIKIDSKIIRQPSLENHRLRGYTYKKKREAINEVLKQRKDHLWQLHVADPSYSALTVNKL
jgi:hypothetical protein